MSTAIDAVIEAIAGYAGVTAPEVISQDRHKTIAVARQISMYVARAHVIPKPSFPELGRRFGNRDHTTVMSACRKIEQRAKTDPWVAAAVDIGRRVVVQSQAKALKAGDDAVLAATLAKCRLRDELKEQVARIETDILETSRAYNAAAETEPAFELVAMGAE